MCETTKTTTTGDSLDLTKNLRYLSGDKISVFVDGKPTVLTEIDVVKRTDSDGNTVTTTDLFFTTDAKSGREEEQLTL